MIVSIRAEYFGSKSFGSIMGISSSVVTVAAVIAPVLAAISYDAFGSYTLSFVTLAVLAALGSLFMVFTPPPSARGPSGGQGARTKGSPSPPRRRAHATVMRLPMFSYASV